MDNLITTVRNIFKKRYGTSLTIEHDFGRMESKPVFLSHWQAPFVYSQTLKEVKFPIFNEKKELQALATVSPVDNKDAVIFEEMAQFLQVTVAEHFRLAEAHEFVTAQEQAIEKSHSDQSKVIDLRTRKKGPEPFQFKKLAQPKVQPEPIWISGKDGDFTAQIAFSIHDWVGNWAFINAKEIPDLVWNDTNNWLNFPEITIFIPNIDELPGGQLSVLLMNLEKIKELGDKRPQVIVTSGEDLTTELIEIKKFFKFYQANDKMTARVQSHFLLYHYKADKPWSHQCRETDQVYFLPLSPNPDQLH